MGGRCEIQVCNGLLSSEPFCMDKGGSLDFMKKYLTIINGVEMMSLNRRRVWIIRVGYRIYLISWRGKNDLSRDSGTYPKSAPLALAPAYLNMISDICIPINRGASFSTNGINYGLKVETVLEQGCMSIAYSIDWKVRSIHSFIYAKTVIPVIIEILIIIIRFVVRTSYTYSEDNRC